MVGNFRLFFYVKQISNSVKFYRIIPVLILLSCFDTKYFCPYVKYQHMHDDNDYCNFSFCCIFALMIPSTTDLNFTATCLSANRLQIFCETSAKSVVCFCNVLVYAWLAQGRLLCLEKILSSQQNSGSGANVKH